MATDPSILDAPDLQMRQIANAIQMGQALTKQQQRRLAVRQGLEAQHGVNPMQFMGQQPGMVPTTYAGPGGQPRVGNLAPAQPAPTVQGSIYQYLAGSRLDPVGQQLGRDTQAVNLAQMQQSLATGAAKFQQEQAMLPLRMQEAQGSIQANQAALEASKMRTAEAQRQREQEMAQEQAAANMMRMGSQLRQGIGGGVLLPQVQSFLASPGMAALGATYGTTPPPQSMLQSAMRDYAMTQRPKQPGMESFNLPDPSTVDPTTVLSIRGKQYTIDTSGEAPAWKPVQTGVFGTEVSTIGGAGKKPSASTTQPVQQTQQKQQGAQFTKGQVVKQGGKRYQFDGNKFVEIK